MSTLITQVKSRLFIASSRISSNALDGDYPSMMRGRSLDFDDLHRYDYGDDIRDIDWRATARLGIPLVKRSRAERAQTILLAVDTGRGMAAIAPDGSEKRELSVIAAGLLAYLAQRHGDQFGMIYGDAAGVQRTEVRRSEGALELMLRAIHAASVPGAAPNSREKLLDTIVRTVSRRCILVVVTDATPISAETERQIRRLQVQHDIVWVTVADADPLGNVSQNMGRNSGQDSRQRGRTTSDVDTSWRVPGFLSSDDEVREELAAIDFAEASARTELLNCFSITHAEISSVETAASELLRMLDRRSRVRT